VIDADTPFGRVARPFFYGNDNEFRNNRFKLIPKVNKLDFMHMFLFYLTFISSFFCRSTRLLMVI
jgi:hypothetical protein